MSHYNVIVLAPHGDDETLGMGGTIHKMAWVHESEIGVYLFTKSDYDGCYEEFDNAVTRLGAEPHHLEIGRNGSLDTQDKGHAITMLDRIIQHHKPNYVFIPAPGIHQDHRFVFEVGMAACRVGTSDGHYSPRNVLLYNPAPYYESPLFINGKETVYSDLTLDEMDAKVAALECYKHKLSNPPKSVNAEAVLYDSKGKGFEIGSDYAESFIPVRIML